MIRGTQHRMCPLHRDGPAIHADRASDPTQHPMLCSRNRFRPTYPSSPLLDRACRRCPSQLPAQSFHGASPLAVKSASLQGASLLPSWLVRLVRLDPRSSTSGARSGPAFRRRSSVRAAGNSAAGCGWAVPTMPFPRLGFSVMRSAIASHSVHRSGGWWVGVPPFASFLGNTYTREAGPVVNTSPLIWMGGPSPLPIIKIRTGPNIRTGSQMCVWVACLSLVSAPPPISGRSSSVFVPLAGSLGRGTPSDATDTCFYELGLATSRGDPSGSPIKTPMDAVRRKRSRVPKPAAGQANPEPNIE